MGAGRGFFKVFFPEQSAELLKIPPPFSEYLEEEPNRMVSLKGPSGNTWQVMLASDPQQGLHFSEGWKVFAGDHSLERGHFLVFTYDGRSEFSVIVYRVSGVEDKAAMVAKPSQGDKTAMVAQPSEGDKMAMVAQPSEGRVVKVEEEEGARDADAAGTPKQGASVPPPAEGSGKTRKRARQVTINDSAPKGQSTVQKRSRKRKTEASGNTSKAGSAARNSDSDSPCMLAEFICSNDTRIRSKDMPRVGKFMLKKFRQPVIVSQRRSITDEEKEYALERAKEFKSENPFTMQIMKESYVYVGFFLNIPCEFVRESLPRTNKKMKLWDPQGKSWEVNYVYYSERSVGAFSGGWGKFSIGNNLEQFDVCIFELFKEDNIRVHIYRVVPEITPLVRYRGGM